MFYTRGWGWEKIAKYLEESVSSDKGPGDWAEEIARLCRHMYGGKPGDDASIVVLKVRHFRRLSIMIGPPAEKEKDPEVVQKLIDSPGKKVVCGGTTGNIVGRYLGRKVVVDLSSTDDRVPPIGIIPGIDLVTEGNLTLVYTLEILQNENNNLSSLVQKKDGASKLAVQLLEADSINFLIGTAVNPALQDPGLPAIFAYKQQIVKDLIKVLKEKGKEIEVEYFKILV